MFRAPPTRRRAADLALAVGFNANTTSDASPSAHTGTLIGGSSVTGKVLSLSGTGQYLTYPDAASLDMPSAFTASVWFEPSTPGSSYRTLIAKERATGNQRSYFFALNYTSNRYECAVNGNGAAYGGANSTNYFFAATLPTAGWHHFLSVYDSSLGAGQRFKLWVDGVSVAATTLATDAAGITPFNCNRELQLGAYDGTLAWKGNLDDCYLIRRALTTNESKQLYYRGREIA